MRARTSFKLVHARVPQDREAPDVGFWADGESEDQDDEEEDDRGDEETSFRDAQRKHLTHNYDRHAIPDGRRLIALLTDDDRAYSALALVKKGSVTSTFQRRVRFDQLVKFKPLTFATIRGQLGSKLALVLDARIGSPISAFPPVTGRAVLSVLYDRRPSLKATTDALLATLDPITIGLGSSTRGWTTMADEKDALDTALSLAGIPPSNLQSFWSQRMKPTPVMELLGSRTIEDRQIEHDAAAFGGLRHLEADLRGAKRFYDAAARSFVTVINVNRSGIESTAGVDLVVSYEAFESLLMIQYKRLMREGSGEESDWRFRPSSDAHFTEELGNMLAGRDHVLGAPIKSQNDYRLCEDAFFFKLCRSDVFSPDQTGMVPGRYVLASDLNHFIGSSESHGPRGAVFVGYSNLRRHLSNSQFLELARNGWIGARSLATKRVLKFIRTSLDAGRSLMLARIGRDKRSDE